MTSKAATIPAGMIFTVTSGEYSDHMVHGVFRALRDISPDDLLAEYLKDNPHEAKPYRFNETRFLSAAYRGGLIECVECMAWDIGAYSTPHMSVEDFTANDVKEAGA